MAEAVTSTFGGDGMRANNSQSIRVPSTRLSRMRRLTLGVQRRVAMFSPARWTNAATPVSFALSNDGTVGSQSTSPSPGRLRTMRVTCCPAAVSRACSADRAGRSNQ